MNYLYNVATKKEVLVTIRIAENVRDEFKIAAQLRGASMSGLMHQYIVRTIREEKELSPHSFTADLHKRIADDIANPGVKATRIKVTNAEPKRKTG